MSNVLTAKNSFQDGLLMDFAPENTGAGNLTNALNATLVTFNGNEMVLLNDMGNGRVETARLPEGFIPVGTCEFGDIIYIVSYNPITDKSQIGCFPSPERNISSDEISNSELSISINDFLELDEYNNPTGKLKKTSVKKVIVETKKLNPGDKYILYTDNDSAIINNKEFLSGYGTGSIESNPKSLKLHVVSIEDSGKITYLDTTTKWYNVDKNDESYSDYLINYQQKVEGGERIDLDSYRDLLESNWSIFSSKVSGKLAILAELETIDTFSCSYDVELTNTDKEPDEETKIIYNYYKLYLYPEYTSKHEDIKPAYIVATKSNFAKSLVEGINTASLIIEDKDKDDEQEFQYNLNSGWELTSDGKIDTGITFKIPYTKSVQSDDKQDVSIKIKSEALIYTMLITPAMDYGRLDHLAQEIIIDFNKIGTGEINLTTWKYHNSETTSILTFGFESYPKPNHEIKAIIMDFYDAQGLCAEYIMSDKKSYNGVFTEYILLEQNTGNFRFANDKINLQALNSFVEFNDKYKYISLVDQIDKLDSELEITPNGSEHTALSLKCLDLKNKLATLEPTMLKYYGSKDNITSDNCIRDLNTILENYNYSERISENDTAQNEKIAAIFNDNFKFDFSNEKFKEPIEHYTNAVYTDDAEYKDNILIESATKFKWVLPKEGGISDVNTIYPNNLYKVIIKVCSAREDNKSNLEVTEFKRWYWTTAMFNNYYYTCNDFQILQFQLELDANVLYFSKPNFVWKEESLNNLNTDKFVESSEFNSEASKDTFSANVAYIGEEDESNLGMSIQAGLANDYGCFNLNKSDLGNIKVNVYLGGGNINYDDTEYSWSIEAQEIKLQTFIEKKNLEIDAGTDPNDIDSKLITEQTSLNDLYNLKFDDKYKSDGKYKFTNNTTSNDLEEYKHYLLTTDLNSCYYASDSDLNTIDLIFKAKLYNKSYVADLLSSKINVPVYKPIVSTIQDLNKLGIAHVIWDSLVDFGEVKIRDTTTRLYFPEGITLGVVDNVLGCNLKFNGPDVEDRYAKISSIVTDDNSNSFSNNSSDVDSSRLISIFLKILPSKGVFFLLYPAWSENADYTKDSVVVTFESTKQWRTLFWKDIDGEHPNVITKNTIDVNAGGGGHFKVDGYSQTPFLAVKHDNVCYILNSAYAAAPKSENSITQSPVYVYENSNGTKQERNTPFYDNFAQQLYLLFTHIYHANCRKTSEESILASNIISNNPFEATLTRDIVVSLSDDTEKVHDIVFRNQSFNQYIHVLQSNINPDPDKDNEGYINMNSVLDSEVDKNVILKYIEKGILSLLTVTKKVKPLTNSSGVAAYYSYNNGLIPLKEELLSDTFFVLQNGELSIYKDHQDLTFDVDSYKLLFEHPMLITPYKLKLGTTQAFNDYITLVFEKLDNSILKYNKQNPVISISIPKGAELILDINNALIAQTTKEHTLGKILRDAAWVIDEERYPEKALYQILFRGKTTKCTNLSSTFNVMGTVFTPEFGHLMVTKLYHMLNFEFQPYPLAFPRLKTEFKPENNINKLIITEFMGCSLKAPIEMSISNNIPTKVPSDSEYTPTQKIVEDIYGRKLTITFGHFAFMKVENTNNLSLPYLEFTLDNETYLISNPKFLNSDNGTYTITIKDSSNINGPLKNIWGIFKITKSAIQPEYKVAYYDALGFKCGLGLNQAFTYNNGLESTVDTGGSFGFGNDDSDEPSTDNKYASANWLLIGSKNQYLDSYFKLDYPELPNWSGVRNITNIENNEN